MEIADPRLFIIWSEAESKGITIPYPNISLHAAQGSGSRGEGSKACIYMQLEGASHLEADPTTNGHTHHTEEQEEEEEEMGELVELHITPSDETTCIFFVVVY